MPTSRSILGPPALGLFLAACAVIPSCYWGFTGGPAFVSGRPGSKPGANSSMDFGLVFDHKRVVRVMYARSLQLYGGAQLTSGGQHIVVPLQNVLEVQVTAHRWPQEMYLRLLARGYWGSQARAGEEGKEITQLGADSYAGMLGATLLFAGDNEQMGPTGIALSLGLLAGRADTQSQGPLTFVAPMVLLGFDVFPPLLIYCVLVDDKCPHHLKLGAKN